MKTYSWLLKNQDRFYKNYLIRICSYGVFRYYAIRLNNKTIKRISKLQEAKNYIDNILTEEERNINEIIAHK